MLNNRGAELGGLSEEDFVSAAWKRILGGVESLVAISDFETRRMHLVPVITRILTDVACEFSQWEATR